jgi:cytosine deaminase
VPFGNANPLEEAILLAKLCHLGTVEGLRTLWNVATVNGARLMRLPQQEGLTTGAPADLILLNATDPVQAMLDGSPPYLVIKAGRKVAHTKIERALIAS